MSKKKELLSFIDGVPPGKLIGIYYLDKLLDIVHYSVFDQDHHCELVKKVEAMRDSLEDDIVSVIHWRVGISLDYLRGVYDGIVEGRSFGGGQ